MNRAHFKSVVLSLLVGALVACVPVQQQPTQSYQPEPGQPGKDVVWLPTSEILVQRMLDVARVTATDYVIDLGSGDGRTVISAAKRGARALGIEYNPELVEFSKNTAAKEGVSDKATFVKADLFESDLSQATVITMFLNTDLNLKLRPKLLELKPGTRIVSNSFSMGEWQADEEVSVRRGCAAHCNAYLWIVPAKVQGTWKLPQGELTLRQSYQVLNGTLTTASNRTPIAHGIMDGERIIFTVGETEYTGRVTGDKIDGGSWTATKLGK